MAEEDDGKVVCLRTWAGRADPYKLARCRALSTRLRDLLTMDMAFCLMGLSHEELDRLEKRVSRLRVVRCPCGA
jgi:hypothetical protein